MDLSHRAKWPEIKVVIKPEDYVFGGITKIKGVILQPSGRWRNCLPRTELQRNNLGDVFGCVSFADNNADEMIHIKKYGHEININDRVLVVGSGTTPNVGNSPSVVSDWKRKNGFVIGEDKWPYPADMSVSTYYNGGVVPQHLLDEAKKSLPIYKTGYQWLDQSILQGNMTVKPEKIQEGLKYSPIEVSVQGMYQYDESGHVKWTGGNYTHEVVIMDWEDDCFWGFDSEFNTIVKFRRDYPFGWPLLKHFEKKKNVGTARHVLNGKAISTLGLGGRFKDKYLTWINGDDAKMIYGDYKNMKPLKSLTKDPDNLDKDHVLVAVNKKAYLKHKEELNS